MTTNDRNAGDQSSIDDRRDGRMSRRNILLAGTALAAASAAASAPSIRTAQAQQPQSVPSGRPPNILVIWGDDIGTWNISHNSRGMMGYQTPNIDRIAREGVSFTDYYGQQSCTAGRAAFIGGVVPVRNGMTKVGLPGAKEGWQKPAIRLSRRCSGTRAMPPVNSARTISVTAMSISRRCTASTNTSAAFITSTLRRGARESRLSQKDPAVSQEIRPARRDPFQVGRQRWANDRGHRPADQEANGNHRRGNPGDGKATSSPARKTRASRSSAGGMRHACTSART